MCRSLRWRAWEISTYKLCLYVGVVIGLPVTAVRAHGAGLDEAAVLATIPVLLAFALVGARVLFLIGHRSATWRPAKGACVWGGVLAALVASIPLLSLLRLPVARYWDVVVPSMLVLAVWGRVGCALHGCCAGRRTASRFALPRREADGSVTRRVPTQLLEATVAAAMLALLVLGVGHTLPAGGTFVLALYVVAGTRCVIGLLREPARTARARAIERLLPVGLTITAGAALLLTWAGTW
jgi:phosphatidylglycerol:prolipoprotein diacylglycerol transferase